MLSGVLFLTLKYKVLLKFFLLSLLAALTILMLYTMDNVVRSENFETSQLATTRLHLQTPPRSPNTTVALAQTLASEIRDIYYALAELPDLTPGNEVNTLLTRLVNLCITPYSQDFITYFSGIEGIHMLCEKLRLLCAAAEGELERFWAGRITEESRISKGVSKY